MDLALAASEQLREPDEREGVRLARTGAVGAMVVLTGAAAALGASAETSEPTSSAVLRATMVAAPMAVGLYAGRVHMYERFGRLLYAMGLAAFVTTLAESSDDGLYTAGRVAGWGVEVLLVYLFLACPSGRLEARADRRLVAAAGGVFAFLLLPLAALARELPLPSQWTSCDAGDRCPANALFAVDHQPAFVDPALRITAAIALFALAVAVATRLQHRISSGSPAVRRMLVPVLAVAMARAAVLGVAILTRELSDDAASAEGLAWLLALSIPALSVAFLVGLLQTRLLAEQALSRLARLVQGVPDAAALRRALGEALDDPTTQIAFPLMGRPGHFIDEHGDPLALPEGDATRSTFVVRDGTEVVAVVVNDAHRTPPPELRAAAAGIASVAIDNQRLIARGRAADVELRGSRARIA